MRYFDDYEKMVIKYLTFTKICFDYAVVDHEPDIVVVRFTGQ